MVKILLVDDHRVFLEGLIGLLEKNEGFEVVGALNASARVINFLECHEVDLVITDLDMPGLSGFDLVKLISRQFSNVKTLVLSMHKDHHVVNGVLEAGALGYIMKDSSTADLFGGIMAVSKGKTYCCKHAAEVLLQRRIQSTPSRQEVIANLSDREKDILILIAQELTQKEIADQLHISSHTVVFHKRKLIDKFNVRGTAGLVKKALELGLIKM